MHLNHYVFDLYSSYFLFKVSFLSAWVVDLYKSDLIPLEILINQGGDILILTSLCAKYEKQKYENTAPQKYEC